MVSKRNTKAEQKVAAAAGQGKGAALVVLEPELADPLPDPEVTTDLPLEVVEQVEVLPAGPEELLPLEDDAAALVESPSDASAESDRRDIVPYDPLNAYLREISKFPRLTRQQEHELALKYFAAKDKESAYKLVSSNLWLVVKIAKDYERAARSILDLIQEGNIGLLEAVKNFDPYRGVRLPSYAVWWIKAYIIRYIIANWRLVKVGTTQAQRKLFFNLKKEKDKLEREGLIPGPKLLAEKLNVKESEVIEMEQRLGQQELSFDAPLDGESDNTLFAVMPHGAESAEQLLLRREMHSLLAERLAEFEATLTPKEKLIFQRRIMSDEKLTLQEVSEQVKVSRERVRQIENRLRERVKSFLQLSMPDMDFENRGDKST